MNMPNLDGIRPPGVIRPGAYKIKIEEAEEKESKST